MAKTAKQEKPQATINAAELNQAEQVKRIGVSLQPTGPDKVISGVKISALAEEAALEIIQSAKGAVHAMASFALGLTDPEQVDTAAQALQQSLMLHDYAGSKTRASEFRAFGYARFVNPKLVKGLPDAKIEVLDKSTGKPVLKDGKPTYRLMDYHSALAFARKMREDGIKSEVLDAKYAPKTAPSANTRAKRVGDVAFATMCEQVKILSAEQWAKFLPIVEAEKAIRDAAGKEVVDK